MAELPTVQALETMTRAQLVATYDALRPTHPQLPERPTHGRGNFTVNIKGALMALLVLTPAYSYSDTCTRKFMDTSGATHSTAKRTTNLTNGRNPPPIAATVYGSPYRSRAIPTTSFTTAAPWEIPTTYSRPLCRAISWTPSSTLEPSIWRLLCPPRCKLSAAIPPLPRFTIRSTPPF